jgi:hypothetical protein
LKQLLDEKIVRRGFGVYLGEHRLRDGPLDVLPLSDFVRQLYAGKILD